MGNKNCATCASFDPAGTGCINDVRIVNPSDAPGNQNFPSPCRPDVKKPDDVCQRHQTPDEYQAHERACARLWDALMVPTGNVSKYVSTESANFLSPCPVSVF